jgi:BolA family transcriptional regulator, general stress-responsive regulator
VKNIISKKIVEKLNIFFKPSSLRIINESFMHNIPADAESHFKLVIVSDKFIDMSLIQRHRSVYSALGSIMNEIHALSIHAFDNLEFNKNPMILDSPQCANKEE